MPDTGSWRALVARAWAVVRLRFTKLPPDCPDCGFPLTLVRDTAPTSWWRRTRWVYDGTDGRCGECEGLRVEALRVKGEADRKQYAEEQALYDEFSAAYAAGLAEYDAGAKLYRWADKFIVQELVNRVVAGRLQRRAYFTDEPTPFSGSAMYFNVRSPVEVLAQQQQQAAYDYFRQQAQQRCNAYGPSLGESLGLLGKSIGRNDLS